MTQTTQKEKTLLSPRIPRDTEHERYHPELEEELLYLLREGKKYGIVCCITTTILQQLPMRIQASVEDWYALQCAQNEDYSYLFSCEQSCIPLTQPGLEKYQPVG